MQAISLSALSFTAGGVLVKLPGNLLKYLPDYMGLIFEKMCRDYLRCYSDRLPIELSETGQWWGTDPKKKKQIQIVRTIS